MILKNLSFKFNRHDNHYFFHNITITFKPHTINIIQGDNGVGKSTLFSLLQNSHSHNALSHTLYDASVILDNTLYTAHNNMLPQTFTKHVHTVQQQYDRMIAHQFSFKENLQLANMSCYPTLNRLPAEHMLDYATRLGIDTQKPVSLLSGGQRQLLAILMSLQKPTKVLLLDEPTATLDTKNTQLIMTCLQQLAQDLQITIIMICHDKQLIDTLKNQGIGTCFIMHQRDDGERIIRAFYKLI